jgi:hypothetical protein
MKKETDVDKVRSAPCSVSVVLTEMECVRLAADAFHFG